MSKVNGKLTNNQTEELLSVLEKRFKSHMGRHRNYSWDKVESKLRAKRDKLYSLYEMERTGGEPDVFGPSGGARRLVYYDFSKESPKGRRSVCYDGAALRSRKEFRPKNSALDMAANMGIEILDEDQYRSLQKLGEFDLKTSSWIKTPDKIRKRGGALFSDRRYDHVFVYHNGASSYYGARGFRGSLTV